MRTHSLALVLVVGAALGCPAGASAHVPDLSVNWIRGGRTVFSEWVFTAEGQRKFESYDTMKRAGFPMERFVVGGRITIAGNPGRRERAVLLRETCYPTAPA